MKSRPLQNFIHISTYQSTISPLTRPKACCSTGGTAPIIDEKTVTPIASPFPTITSTMCEEGSSSSQ
ncbi:hypothetical protein RDI58_025025 [Solanum bulbocastanum]|uniref:Uncharacterized protein n=1 Tax=Solanum bulbocastanum TaxID=147425 RepID=A0AAN8T4C9_SOLBU